MADKKKPNFVVKESHYQARVKKRWRLPRGRHSGVRQYHKGKPAMPTSGYGSDKKIRGLHSSGLYPVVVYTKNDLLKLEEKQGGVIASSIGKRKKLELLKLAEEKKLLLINVKDVPAEIKNIEDAFTKRKEVKKAKTEERTKKASEREKKAAEKKKKEEEKTKKEEEKSSLEESVEEKKEEKEEQKKMVEKTITKRQ